jgi:hypothetical protein
MEVLAHFMASAELAKISVVEALSGGLELPLLSPGVELDGEAAALIDVAWADIAAQKAATLTAITMLSASPSSAHALRPAGHAAPSAAPLDSLRQAASSFFDWAGGAGTRSRQRIQAIMAALPADERSRLHAQWRETYPDSAAASADESAFFSGLQSGRYDGTASALHSQLLDVSATSDDVSGYAEVAQDKDLLLARVVVEEGAEGLKRGAELQLEASTTALDAVLPGFARGRELAEKAAKVAGYADTAYGAASGREGALGDLVRDAAGELLGESIEAEDLDEIAGIVGGAAGSVFAGADYIAAKRAGTGIPDGYGRTSIWEPDATLAVVSNDSGQSASGPQAILAIKEADGLSFDGAPGRYSVQTFDEAGRQLGVHKAEVEAGWETVTGRSTVSVDREAQRALLARTPVPRATPTPVVPPEFDWVLSEVVINKDKDPLRQNHGGEYYVGQYIEWTLSDGSLSQHAFGMFRGVHTYDMTFTYAFDRPPERLEPGQEFELRANATTSGKFENGAGGYPGAEFQFVPRTGPTLIVAWNKATASMSQKFTAPKTMSARYEVGAILWNCAPCDVIYVYTPEVVAPVVKVPEVSPAEVLAQEYADCEDRFASDLFRGICRGAREGKDALEAAELRAGLPNPCLSPKTEDERNGCAALQAIQADDLARCNSLPEDVRLLCLVPIAMDRGDPSLLAPYGDQVLAIYAGTGDLSVLPLIKDPRIHDGSAVMLLGHMLSYLFRDDDEPRIPSRDYCARLRGGWEYDPDDPRGEENMRQLCEATVGQVRAIQLDSEAECVAAGARADEYEMYEEDLGEARTACLDALADYRSIAVKRR